MPSVNQQVRSNARTCRWSRIEKLSRRPNEKTKGNKINHLPRTARVTHFTKKITSTSMNTPKIALKITYHR